MVKSRAHSDDIDLYDSKLEHICVYATLNLPK